MKKEMKNETKVTKLEITLYVAVTIILVPLIIISFRERKPVPVPLPPTQIVGGYKVEHISLGVVEVKALPENKRLTEKEFELTGGYPDKVEEELRKTYKITKVVPCGPYHFIFQLEPE